LVLQVSTPNEEESAFWELVETGNVSGAKEFLKELDSQQAFDINKKNYVVRGHFRKLLINEFLIPVLVGVKCYTLLQNVIYTCIGIHCSCHGCD
jgi:hypothetical protein